MMSMKTAMARLVVSDLPREITDDAFKEHFKAFGDVSFCMIARAPDQDRSHLGMIRFADPLSATLALIERHVILRTEVRVERPDFLGMREISAKIFIGGLPRDLTDGELKEYFEKFGTLVDHVIIRCEAGCSKGFGFVTFARAESLREVFRNQPHQIKGKTVEVKQAIPKDGTISRLGGSGSSSPYHNPSDNRMAQNGFPRHGSEQ